MIIIKLKGDVIAKVNHGVWSVPESQVLEDVLNAPHHQPPNNGHYAPTEDARKAQYVLKTWGGEWVRSDETFAPGKLY